MRLMHAHLMLEHVAGCQLVGAAVHHACVAFTLAVSQAIQQVIDHVSGGDSPLFKAFIHTFPLVTTTPPKLKKRR